MSASSESGPSREAESVRPGARLSSGPSYKSARLTARESEIVRLRIAGLTCSQIAVQLGISPETVKAHRRNIAAKSLLVGRDGSDVPPVATEAK